MQLFWAGGGPRACRPLDPSVGAVTAPILLPLLQPSGLPPFVPLDFRKQPVEAGL